MTSLTKKVESCEETSLNIRGETSCMVLLKHQCMDAYLQQFTQAGPETKT